MKISQLKEGMLLVVSTEMDHPVVRLNEPDRIVFFPDIFAKAGMPNIFALNKNAYYMYVGKVVITIPEDMRENFRGKKTKSHHELMDEKGMVWKIHGREFKNFEPAWRENENSNN